MNFNYTPPSCITDAIEWESNIIDRLSNSGLEPKPGNKRIVGLGESEIFKIPRLHARNFYEGYDARKYGIEEEGVPEHMGDSVNQIFKWIYEGLKNNINELNISPQYRDRFIMPTLSGTDIPQVILDTFKEGLNYRKAITKEFDISNSSFAMAECVEHIVIQKKGKDVPYDDIQDFFSRLDDFVGCNIDFDEENGDVLDNVIHDISGKDNWKLNTLGDMKLVDYGHDNWKQVIELYGRKIEDIIYPTK